MRTGFKSGYWVVEWADDFAPNLADLVSRIPEIVRGNRIAIASCDSGPFLPTEAEYAKGWTNDYGVAVSPIVDSITDLPTPRFDEWYVYAGVVPNSRHAAFVNAWGFAPLDESNSEAQEFWAQVEQFRPLHVVGTSTPTMFLATQDEEVFRKVSGT